MEKGYSTIGYGLLLDETILMLDAVLKSRDIEAVRSFCIEHWPQKSISNKERLWRHLKYRFLEIDGNAIIETPFLRMYKHVQGSSDDVRDLLFHRLCVTTPILMEILKLLVTESFLNTGEAVFSGYHLDQLMESKYDRLPKSTRDRVRSVLLKSGRLEQSKTNFFVKSYCPSDAVLGYALYSDSSANAWRAPSTKTIISDGTIAPIFLCNQPLLISGIKKLASKGFCEYHQHGSTDQVQLTYQSLEEYADAWN